MDDLTKKTPPKEEKEEEEEEDAFSLSNFPLQNSSDKKTQEKRRSSSEPSDFFEFFTADNYMSHAEDIIFRGKLVPFTNHHPFLKSLSADDATRFSRSPIQFLPTTSTRTHLSRRFPDDHKTLRCCRRRRHWTRPDAGGNIRRSFSKRSAMSDGSPPSKATKPRWFVLMFGPLKLQPEMDLREMKSRLGRRSPVSMFPSADADGGDVPVGRRGFWGFDLLRVLSCKSHASVAVTAPSVGLAPRC